MIPNEIDKSAETGEPSAAIAPVVQDTADRQQWAVHLHMPPGFSPESLPDPVSDHLSVTMSAEKRFAVVRFPGRPSEGRIAARTEELETWMAGEGLLAAHRPRLRSDDLPWRLPFLRKNEIVIPVANEAEAASAPG